MLLSMILAVGFNIIPFASAADGSERALFVSAHYDITIWRNCSNAPQSQFGCPLVGYVYDRVKHRSHAVSGNEAIEMSCPTGARCHTGTLLYSLRGGGYSYELSQPGDLIIQQGERKILAEHGEWQRLAPNNSFKPKPLRGSA